MKIKTVAPQIWKSHVDHLEPASRMVLEMLHSQHVGITPLLAEGLVKWFMRDSTGRESRVWKRVFRRLDVALGSHERGSARRVNALRFRAMAAPAYCVLRIALPVVHKACCRLGTSILFSYSRRSCTAAEYEKYGDQLAEAVWELAESNHFSDAFWSERAEVLAQASNASRLGCLVDCPVPSVLLFERLKPHAPADRKPLQRIPRSAQHEISPVLAFQGENVDGIIQSSRMEDLPNQILSEWALPDDMWLVRFAESGLLVRHKPPLKDYSRDLLLVLAIPESLRRTPLSPFVKSCWYHLCSRLAYHLLQNQMLKTEFRLVEGYPTGYYRSKTFDLERLAFLPSSYDMPEDTFRTYFRVALNWLPGLLGQRGQLRPTPRDCIPRNGHQPLEWLTKVWQQQREETRYSLAGEQIDLTSYEHVLVNVVLSAGYIDAWTGFRRTLEKRLFAESIQGRHLIITWIDPDLQPGENWSLQTQREQRTPLLADTAGNLDGAGAPTAVLSLNWLATRVVEGWWREIRRELWNA